jgi:hypothetical protein
VGNPAGGTLRRLPYLPSESKCLEQRSTGKVWFKNFFGIQLIILNNINNLFMFNLLELSNFSRNINISHIKTYESFI